MTRADTPNRVRFEIRVLGVATAETFYVEEQVPDGWPLPAVGDLAYPRDIEGSPRRVARVETVPMNDLRASRRDGVACGARVGSM